MRFNHQTTTAGTKTAPGSDRFGPSAARRVRARSAKKATVPNLGPLALATIGALSLMFAASPAQARNKVDSPYSPFAIVPAHLRTLTTSEQAPVRPLLVFQMGSAGSFGTIDTVTIDGKKVSKARWFIAQELLLKYTKKYGNNIQWAWYTDTEALNRGGHIIRCDEAWSRWVKLKDWPSCKNQAMDDMLKYYLDTYGGENQWALRRYTNVKLSDQYLKIGSFQRNGIWGDYDTFARKLADTGIAASSDFRPLSLNYAVNPTVVLRYNIRYRCQPAFYVVVDDGLQQQWLNPFRTMGQTSENAIHGVFELARHGINFYPWKKIQITEFQDLSGPKWWNYRDPLNWVKSYDYACMKLFAEKPANFDYKNAQLPSDGSCGMRFFSHSLATVDLMPNDNLPPGRPVDDAGKSWDDPQFPTQSIKTFSIRINTKPFTNYDPYSWHSNISQTYIRMKGIASQDDYFFNVTNGDQLKNAFDSIIRTVEKSIQYGKVTSYSTISPALGAPEMSPVPNSAANVRLNMFKGASEIRFHKVSSSSDPDKFKKSDDAKAEYDQAATYKIKVDLKNYMLPLFSDRFPVFGVKNKAHFKSDLEGLGFGREDFDLPEGSHSWAYKTEWRDSLLSWLTRTRKDEDIQDEPANAITYRIRKTEDDFDSRSMGDIIDTPVLDIGQYLTTAANDGMVYVFKRLNDKDGHFSLKLNYVPFNVTREDKNDIMRKHYRLLVHPEYSQTPEKPHQFMINGGMNWRLTAANANGNRNLIVAGSYGQGGRGAYVLRIAGNDLKAGTPTGIESNQNSWKSNILMFNVDAEQYPEMGYTFGDPQIGNVALNRLTKNIPNTKRFETEFSSDHYYYAMFLSSGFNNPSEGVTGTESALYVFNLFDYMFGSSWVHHEQGHDKGKLIKKILANKKGGGLAQSTLVDLDNDGIVDIAYAGDYNGNLYRFDFKNGMEKAVAVPIFQAPNGQHFTSAPAVLKVKKKDDQTKQQVETGEMMVVIGTGSDIYETDADDKGQNAVYGIKDDVSDVQPTVLSISDLQQQTLETTGKAIDRRGVEVETRIGSNTVNPSAKGWYMNLSEGTGERVVTKPVIYDGMAVVTTRMYDVKSNETNTASANTPGENHDPCVQKTSTQSISGKGWIMQFDAMTGSIPKDFDFKTDERESAYVDFLGHLDDSKNAIVSGVMEPGSGIPSLSMSGDKAVAEKIQIMKGEDLNRYLQLDANFEGDIGGSGVSGDIRKLSKKGDDKQPNNYNLLEMKIDRKKIVPALFVSTSSKGLQDPFTLAIKHIPKPKTPPPPAGQTQILKRLSYKVVD